MGSRTIRSGVIRSTKQMKTYLTKTTRSCRIPESRTLKGNESYRDSTVLSIFACLSPPGLYSRNVTKLRRRRRRRRQRRRRKRRRRRRQRQQESLKPNGFYEQNWTTLQVHHAFYVHFFAIPDQPYMYDVELPNCKLTWERERQGDKFYSLWTRTQSPLFSCNLTSLLSSNWVTWHQGKKKGCEVYFSATFSLASALSDRTY